MRRGLPRLVVASSLLSPGLADAQRLQLRELCDEGTLLTLIGVDTRAGAVLLGMASRQAEVPGWLLDLRPGAERVPFHPDRQREGRFGGSVGPGPVFSFRSCGTECVQAEAWQDGSWRDLGAPLRAPGPATLHATWDGDGAAWVLLRRLGASPSEVDLQAFRLHAGIWQSRGRGAARVVGSPGVRPDPDHPDAVIAGTLRFSASGPPEPSVLTLPTVPNGGRATLLPLVGGAVALLTEESRLFVTADRGARWREQLWTPWGSRRAAQPGGGDDYWLDLPDGYDADLPLLWMDERTHRDRAITLTTGIGSRGHILEGVPAAEPLELAARFADGAWLLVGGCRRDQRTAYLRLRSDAGPWRHLPLAAGWEP